MNPTSSDLAAIQQRLARQRNPKQAHQQDAAKTEKWAAGAEREMSRQFAAYLTQRELLFVCANPTKKSTIRVGWPDFSIFLPRQNSLGVTIFVELKVKDGYLSKDQVVCIESLQKASFPITVAYSLEAAIAFVRQYAP